MLDVNATERLPPILLQVEMPRDFMGSIIPFAGTRQDWPMEQCFI